MKNVLEASSIESFFTFLDSHIEKGFNELKMKYSLEYYTYEEYNYTPIEFKDGYYLVYPTSESDLLEYRNNDRKGETYKLYLNPITQKKVRIEKLLGVEQEPIRYSLYNELYSMYNSECQSFYKNLLREIANRLISSEEQLKITVKNFLNRISNYKVQAESKQFLIKDNANKDCLLLYIILTKLTEKIQSTYLETNNKIPKKKQPSAEVVMEFINTIDMYPPPSEDLNNDEKYALLANWIKDNFQYEFSGGTLENNAKGVDGYSPKVFKLLKLWGYNKEATRYKADNNVK